MTTHQSDNHRRSMSRGIAILAALNERERGWGGGSWGGRRHWSSLRDCRRGGDDGSHNEQRPDHRKSP